MIKLVKRASLKWFAFYCFAVGIAAALYTFCNMLSPQEFLDGQLIAD
jgi:hypothetical protein